MNEARPVALIVTLALVGTAVVVGAAWRWPAGTPSGAAVPGGRAGASVLQPRVPEAGPSTVRTASPPAHQGAAAPWTASGSGAAPAERGGGAPATPARTTPTPASLGRAAPVAAPAAGCTSVTTADQYAACGPDGSIACLTYQTPAPLWGTLSGWRCSVEVGTGGALRVYTVQHACAGLAQAMTCRRETIGQATLLLDAGGCPGPVTGTISGPGNRLPLTVRIVGPAGSREIAAILDTGGVDTQLPNADMLAVGLRPTTETSASWPLVQSRPVREWTYTAAYPEIYDNGAWVPLGFGTTTIHGADVPAGVSPLVGPDMLQAGTRLATDGRTFTLTPPCPGHGTA